MCSAMLVQVNTHFSKAAVSLDFHEDIDMSPLLKALIS